MKVSLNITVNCWLNHHFGGFRKRQRSISPLMLMSFWSGWKEIQVYNACCWPKERYSLARANSYTTLYHPYPRHGPVPHWRDADEMHPWL